MKPTEPPTTQSCSTALSFQELKLRFSSATNDVYGDRMPPYCEGATRLSIISPMRWIVLKPLRAADVQKLDALALELTAQSSAVPL